MYAIRSYYEKFKEAPKWLIGFSDITVLHAYFQKEGFCSIHGPMPGFYLNEGQPTASYRQLVQLISGNLPVYSFDQAQLNKTGNATGELCGGNLSIVYSLLGTPQQIETNTKILFIEDLVITSYSIHYTKLYDS